MALRRGEDEAYATASGVDEARRWEYREAPHRGYDSPAALFAGMREDDAVWQPIRDDFVTMDAELQPDLVFAPQGLGNHVDHLHVIQAVLGTWPAERVVWYRDTPYAIREPDARPCGILRMEEDLFARRVSLPPEVLERKVAGCSLYASQIGFQFGGPDGVREKLTTFHRREAAPDTGTFAEVLLGHPCVTTLLPA